MIQNSRIREPFHGLAPSLDRPLRAAVSHFPRFFFFFFFFCLRSVALPGPSPSPGAAAAGFASRRRPAVAICFRGPVVAAPVARLLSSARTAVALVDFASSVAPSAPVPHRVSQVHEAPPAPFGGRGTFSCCALDSPYFSLILFVIPTRGSDVLVLIIFF